MIGKITAKALDGSRRSFCAAVFLSIATVSLAQTPTDVPQSAPTPNSEKTSGSEKAVCVDEDAGHAVIDWLHSRLYRLTCSSASWFDGLFGNERYDSEYRNTHGSLTAGTLWSQRESFDKVLRFQARLYLPQADKRLHAFIGRVDREDYVTEAHADAYGLPKEFNRDVQETTLVGIGYNEPLTKRGSFDASTGVHIEFPLDPYIKGSYRFARPVGEHNLLRLRETAFWENSEGLGVTSRLDWDHVIGDKHLVRYTASGTFSQESVGVRWFNNLTLYHFLVSSRALAYELAANGETDLAVPLADYGASVIFRQRIAREWLLLELRVGVDWPRQTLIETRRSNLNAGLAFELRFGRQDESPAAPPSQNSKQ